jgi:hypothetical protein
MNFVVRPRANDARLYISINTLTNAAEDMLEKRADPTEVYEGDVRRSSTQ